MTQFSNHYRLKPVAIFRWCYWPKMNLSVVCFVRCTGYQTGFKELKKPHNKYYVCTRYSKFYLQHISKPRTKVKNFLRLSHLGKRLWTSRENLISSDRCSRTRLDVSSVIYKWGSEWQPMGLTPRPEAPGVERPRISFDLRKTSSRSL